MPSRSGPTAALTAFAHLNSEARTPFDAAAPGIAVRRFAHEPVDEVAALRPAARIKPKAEMVGVRVCIAAWFLEVSRLG